MKEYLLPLSLNQHIAFLLLLLHIHFHHYYLCNRARVGSIDKLRLSMISISRYSPSASSYMSWNFFQYGLFSIEFRLMQIGKLLVLMQVKRKRKELSSFTYLHFKRRIKFLLDQLCNSLLSYCYSQRHSVFKNVALGALDWEWKKEL